MNSALPFRRDQALDELKRLRSGPGFDENQFIRWDADRFAEENGISTEELFEVIRASRPAFSADRFAWIGAVNRRHDFGVRTLRVAVALFGFVGPHGYAWPSQRAIAARAGYDGDERSVRRGIEQLKGAGALRSLKVANLPRELADKALSSVESGGSGRTYRGTAYALVPVEHWADRGLTGSPWPGEKRATVALHNQQSKPEPLSRDSFLSSVGASSETFQNKAPISGRGGKHAD